MEGQKVSQSSDHSVFSLSAQSFIFSYWSHLASVSYTFPHLCAAYWRPHALIHARRLVVLDWVKKRMKLGEKIARAHTRVSRGNMNMEATSTSSLSTYDGYDRSFEFWTHPHSTLLFLEISQSQSCACQTPQRSEVDTSKGWRGIDWVVWKLSSKNLSMTPSITWQGVGCPPCLRLRFRSFLAVEGSDPVLSCSCSHSKGSMLQLVRDQLPASLLILIERDDLI